MIYIWNAIVYCGALWLLGVPLWKDIIVGVVASTTLHMAYGARWVPRMGFALLCVAILTWIGALPDPHRWTDDLKHIIVAISGS